MAFDDNSGTNRLARILTSRMKQEGDTPISLDFGIINGNMSLKTNTFPAEIPKGQYSVCRGMLIGQAGSAMEGGGEGMTVPENLRSVKPGDRVLVGWVFHEAVVIDILLSSSRL